MNLNNSLNVNDLQELSWSLVYLYPEMFSNGKIPDNNAYPTSTMTLDMERIFKVSQHGDFIVYFSPITESYISYFPPHDIMYDGLNLGTNTEYIVYADNNGYDISASNNRLLNCSQWGYSRYPSTRISSFYKKLRIIGSYIELEVLDKEINECGMIESCQFFQVAGNGLHNDDIDISKMSSFSNYTTYQTGKTVFIRYKQTNTKFEKFGPYEPYLSIPFFLIRGKSFSPNAHVKVNYKIHVEGILTNELAHFSTNKTFRAIDKDYDTQKTIISEVEKIINREKVANVDSIDSGIDNRSKDMSYTSTKIQDFLSRPLVGLKNDIEDDDIDDNDYSINDSIAAKKKKLYKKKQEVKYKPPKDDLVKLAKKLEESVFETNTDSLPDISMYNNPFIGAPILNGNKHAGIIEMLKSSFYNQKSAIYGLIKKVHDEDLRIEPKESYQMLLQNAGAYDKKPEETILSNLWNQYSILNSIADSGVVKSTVAMAKLHDFQKKAKLLATGGAAFYGLLLGLNSPVGVMAKQIGAPLVNALAN